MIMARSPGGSSIGLSLPMFCLTETSFSTPCRHNSLSRSEIQGSGRRVTPKSKLGAPRRGPVGHLVSDCHSPRWVRPPPRGSGGRPVVPFPAANRTRDLYLLDLHLAHRCPY